MFNVVAMVMSYNKIVSNIFLYLDRAFILLVNSQFLRPDYHQDQNSTRMNAMIFSSIMRNREALPHDILA